MTTTQAVETSVTVSPIQDYIHPDDHTLNQLILHIFNFKLVSRWPKLFKFSTQNPVKKINIHVNVQCTCTFSCVEMLLFLAFNEMIFSFLCRHVVRFSILRPTTDLIAQMYYCRGASKIWCAKYVNSKRTQSLCL